MTLTCPEPVSRPGAGAAVAMDSRSILLHGMAHACLVFMLSVPLPASAAKWTLRPDVQLITGYNDNIRLTSLDHSSVWTASLRPSTKFGVSTPVQGLTGDAAVVIRRFTGGSGRESSSVLNREDYFLNTLAYHNTLLDKFRATLNYTRDSTLDTQLDETGIVNDSRATRQSLSLGPSWQRILTQRASLALDYRYNSVSYSSEPGFTSLVDYEYHTGQAVLAYQFTPRYQASVAATYSSYKPDSGFNTDTVSLQAGLTTSFSNTLTMSFLAGQRLSGTDRLVSSGFCVGAAPGASFPDCTGGTAYAVGQQKITVDTTSAVFSFGLTKTLETGSINANLTRSSSPGSNGQLLDATRLSLKVASDYTQTLSSSVKLEYTRNQGVVRDAGAQNLVNRDFARLTPTLSWRMRRNWILAGEYSYSRADRSGGQNTSRNVLYLKLEYIPPERSLSR